MIDVLIEALSHVICGIIIGFLIFYSGVGGGVLVIPVVIAFFDLTISVAIGTASAYTALTKAMAGVEHFRINNINKRLCVIIGLSALPGALLTAVAVNYFVTDAASAPVAQEVLRYAVAVVIVLALAVAHFKPEKMVVSSLPLLLAAGFGIGLVMGGTGIGGGVLIAPALMLLSSETPKRIVGTSIIIALILSTLTAIVYASGGQVDYQMAIGMTVGSLLAIPLASKVLRRSSERSVQNALTALICIALLLVVFGEQVNLAIKSARDMMIH